MRALQVTGAVCFIASIAMGGRAYLMAFDAVAPAGTSSLIPLAIDVGLFSTFALHHSLLARTRAKRWIRSLVGVDAERACYIILASVLFFACTHWWEPLPGTWYALTGVWWWVGTAVQGAGVVVTLIAARTLSLRELMGLDPPRQAASREEMPGLETRGLYKVVRHPIYFGWVLLVAGAPLMTSTRLLFAAISVAYLVVAIPFEERSLTESFGEPYRVYRQRVRSKMIPGLY